MYKIMFYGGMAGTIFMLVITVFIFIKTGFQETSHGCRTQGKTVCSICGTSWTG